MKDRNYSYDYQVGLEERKDCFSKHLTTWRIDAGLSIADVADRMGVAPTTVRRIEKAPINASVNTIARFAHACGLNIRIRPI